MVWEVITYGNRSGILFIQSNITVACHVENMIQFNLLIYLGGYPHAPFQQNNARPYFASQTMNFFRKAGIYIMGGHLTIHNIVKFNIF